MIASEKDRELIEAELNQINEGTWLKLVSEIHDFGKELHFWFLVEDKQHAEETFKKVTSTLREILPRFHATEVDASFSEIEGDEHIIWDFVDDCQLRVGLQREFAASPQKFKVRYDNLFFAAVTPDSR